MYEQILERSSFSLRLWRTFSGLCAPGTPAEPCRGGEIWTYASSEAGAVWVSWGGSFLWPFFEHVTKISRFFVSRSIESVKRRFTVWEVRNLHGGGILQSGHH